MELDLFWQQGGKNWGAEFKFSDAPRLSKAMTIAMEDLHLKTLWVVYPGNRTYAVAENIIVLPLAEIHSIEEHLAAE